MKVRRTQNPRSPRSLTCEDCCCIMADVLSPWWCEKTPRPSQRRAGPTLPIFLLLFQPRSWQGSQDWKCLWTRDHPWQLRAGKRRKRLWLIDCHPITQLYLCDSNVMNHSLTKYNTRGMSRPFNERGRAGGASTKSHQVHSIIGPEEP